MNASTADFAATAPWTGITGRPATFPSDPYQLAPAGAQDQSLLIYKASANRWEPVTPARVASLLRPLLSFTAADVGLANVDDTSDLTKDGAAATLTNKTILGATIRLTQQLGLLSPTGFNLFLETSSSLGADRTLTLLLDDADHTLDLAGDLTLLGGNLIVSLSDGTGGGEDRTLTLDGDLTVRTNGAPRTVDLTDDLSLLGDFPLILRLTAATDLILPTTGTLATVADVETRQPLTGNSFDVTSLPAAAANVGRAVYCTNGSAGLPCAAMSDGTNWKVIALGATVSP